MTAQSESSTDLVRLQHKHRSGPGEYILAGGGKFELDVNGNVDVTAAAAADMLQGENWRPSWASRTVDPTLQPEITNGARAPRTAAQLHGLAAAEGLLPVPANSVPTTPMSEDETGEHVDIVVVPGPTETGDHAFVADVLAALDTPEGAAVADALAEHESTAGGDVVPEHESTELVEVHEGMTRAALRAVADRVGVDVAPNASKAQILEALQQSAGS